MQTKYLLIEDIGNGLVGVRPYVPIKDATRPLYSVLIGTCETGGLILFIEYSWLTDYGVRALFELGMDAVGEYYPTTDAIMSDADVDMSEFGAGDES